MSINKDFKNLSKDEQRAFIAWFRGGMQYIIKKQNSSHVSFGKSQCEQVDFNDFWLKKLPELGWITVEVFQEFTCKGIIGTPRAIEYKLTPTDLGYKVLAEYKANKLCNPYSVS